jgi:hypothetical protein
LKEIVDEIVGTYDELDYDKQCGDICSFAVFTNDIKHKDTFNLRVCHANLRFVTAGVYDQLITSYLAKTDIDEKFFNFMKNVMYRKYAEFIHLERSDDDVPYIRISDLDKIPANVVYNFCICSRMIVEYPKTVKKWSMLCDLGFHPSLALAVSRAELPKKADGSINPDVIVTDVGCDYEHWPFYLKSSIRALIKGEMLTTAASFKSRPMQCIPTNKIWGDAPDLRELKGKTLNEFWAKWKEVAE